MKSFKVTFFNPKDPSERYNDIIKVKSEIILKEMIRSKGYEIDGLIEEIEVEDTFIDKSQEWFSRNFSTSYWYKVDDEVDFLDAYAEALSDWETERSALVTAKYFFWKSSKAIRSKIDDMIDIYDKWWFSHIYEVFTKNEEMFSENFLTLMRQSRDTETSIWKIISNPVESKDRWQEVEWYVQLTRSLNTLMKNLQWELTKPIAWFLWMFGFIMAISLWIVPIMLEWFGKIRDISKDNYYWFWEIVIGTSNFLMNYWIYLLWLIIWIISVIVFMYRTNESFKEGFHKYMLNMFIVWDILTLVYTKKLTSIIAIYHESWMTWNKIFESIMPMVWLIPIKQELEFIWQNVWSYDYETIFSNYPENEKYFTEMFYNQLAKESNSSWGWDTWRFKKAFAMILKNTDDLWNKSVSKYPAKIGSIIFSVWFVVVWVYVIGLLILIMMTSLNSI